MPTEKARDSIERVGSFDVETPEKPLLDNHNSESEALPTYQKEVSSETSATYKPKTNFFGLPNSRGITRNAIWIQFVAGIIFGYNTGIIADASQSIQKEVGATDEQIEIIAASILLGGAIGSLGSGDLVDKYGRRPVARFFAVISVIGAVFVSAVPIWYVIAIARLVLGLSLGGFSYIGPLYAGEVSPPSVRGILTVLIQVSIVFFIFVSYLVGLALQNVPNAWQYMFGIAIIASVWMFYLTFFKMSESPRWLVINGKEAEARPLIAEFLGEGLVDEEVASIKASMNTKQAGWREVFSWEMRKPMFIGILLALVNQLAGNNAVTYYAPRILADAGFKSGTVANAVTVGVGFWKLVNVIVAYLLVEKFGRRKLMLGGLVVMGTGAGVLGIAFLVLGNSALAPVAMITILMFVGGYELGPGPMFFVLMAEIYPDKIRGRGMSFINMQQWSYNFFVTIVFVTAVDAIGGGPVFFIFFGIIFISTSFLFVLLRETAGKTLAEVQRDMMDEPVDTVVDPVKKV